MAEKNAMQLFSLKGKNAIVTGGGQGLGKAMAIALAQAGADIIIAARHIETALEAQKLIQAEGVKCTVIKGDMYWALAYGENAMSVSKALKGGITMATTRYRFGDDFTIENYKETENLNPKEEGTVFADKLKKLLGNKVCCVPVVHVKEINTTTVGLGDSFVGGFLPALLP